MIREGVDLSSVLLEAKSYQHALSAAEDEARCEAICRRE